MSSDSDSSAVTGIPAIRTFQFDSSSIGQLSSAVNLFRGDVNIPQTLFTLPGRHSGGGLDVDFTIFYQSNVYRQAILWNRDAPTGVLGLGWDLPLTYIDATTNGSPDPDTRTYVLYDNGNPNTLVRQPQQPFLFAIPSATANALQSGQPVSTDVLNLFLQTGLPLSATATVSGTAGSWSIGDDDLQQCFLLQTSPTDATVSNVYYGGQAFQLQSYKFWHIVYFQTYERWLIVTDKGIRKSFGGIAPDIQAYCASVGNSVAWQVWWSVNGVPVWTGPSSLTTGQMQVATSWYLASASDPFGDTVTYVYNGFPRGSSGLIPDVEQQVGTGGLPYTKAVYLTQITDAFGRTAVLNYGDKMWDDSTDASPREYSDPHNAVPGNDPNPYQDQYETKYLSSIALSAPNGTLVSTVVFSYNVTNVTASQGSMAGDTFKRYLTGVTIQNGAGASLPGYQYEYFTASGSQPGALQTVTSPQGGQATYTYTQQELPVCTRWQNVASPSVDSSPRVFYGDNYVVTVWINAQQSAITLQVWSWYGQWMPWSLTEDLVIDNNDQFNPLTVNVLATSQFFALTFNRTSTSVAYVFNKAASSPGNFVPAVINGITTGVNTPTLTFQMSSGSVTYAAGASFFAAAQMNIEASQNPWMYEVFTYCWVTQAWTTQTVNPPNQTVLAASGEYLLALDSQGTVTMAYLDGTLHWNYPAALTNTGFEFPGTYAQNVALAAGPGFAALNLLQSSSASLRTYQIVILQWDAAHALQVAANNTIIEPQPANAPSAPWYPNIVSNSMVAVNGILYRYNGANWIANTSLMVSHPQPGTGQRYAYGADYALQVITNSRGYAASAAALGYNPAAAWNPTPASPPLVPSQYLYDNFPAATDDYAALGPSIYFRGTATDWTQVFSSTGQVIGNFSTLSPGFDSESIINEGPDFLSYSLLPSNSGNPTVSSILLQNGQVLNAAAVPFPTEKIFTAALEGPPGPGMSPQGPGLFVTYLATDLAFKSATEIFLHQYAGAGVAGPLTHYPVTQIAIDDQYQEVATTSYYPNPNYAACDPTGLVIKYYQNTVYPGTSNPQAALPYGYTVNTYLNGLNYSSGNYYDMLDGLLIETDIYDNNGNQLESHVSSWSVIDQVASDPVDPSAPPIQLNGGWVARATQTNVIDGVSTTKTSVFVPEGLSAPYTGRPASISTTSSNGAGTTETWTQTFAYGVEVNPAMRALNMRSAQAQITTTQQSSSGPVTVKSSASSFVPWLSAVTGVLVPAQEASFRFLNAGAVAFPYASYSPGSIPSGWLLDNRITQRTTRGQVLAKVDPCGTASFTIFSADVTYPVAQISNASSGAAAYFGFEPYENTSGWNLENTGLDTTNARTGTTSLLLPGGASAQLSVAVATQSQAYVTGFWYQTAADFIPASGAGCSVDAGGAILTAAFANTGGEWVYATIGVPAGATSITVTIANIAAQDVWLDSVLVTPLIGSLIARTYDPVTQSLTSAQDSGGRTRWMYYDAFQRSTLQVGPNGQPKELAQRFLSCQGSADGSFDIASPNAEVTLHPADGGTMETFLDGAVWQQNWNPSNAANWQASDGTLAHTSSTPDTLTYHGTPSSTFAVYFEIAPGSAPELTVTVGNVSVSWSGSAYSGSAAGSVLPPLAMPPAIALHWLLIAGDGIVLFFGDGQLIFSETGSFDFAAPVISTSSVLSMTHLAILATPRVGLSYNDGSGRQRQVHQLYGADSRVSEVIYDPLDRIVATTRVVPGSFGSGASQPPLQYRAGFVDVTGFLSALSTTGLMTGDVADYYAGQIVNGIQRSNDQGYPYSGTRWEASPRHRKVELGQPGELYAIANPSSTTPAARATTQFAYGANNGTSPPLPAGQYSQTTVTTPTKSNALRVSDRLGQSVATVQQNGTGTTAESLGIRSYTQAAQTTLSLQMPNALLSGPQSNNANFVRITVADAAGRAMIASDPNAGQTQFLYDPCGRIRFVQPALNAGEQWFLYNKYDAIGRLLEQGTIPQAWDPTVLAANAADVSWPGPTVTRTIALVWTYDGDGNTAASIGQKTTCITTTSASSGTACVATENFTYDPTGRLIAVALALSGAAAAQGVTGYAYNNLGELATLTMPSGSPLAEVIYSLNDQGWITSIGSSTASPADIAAYTYTIDGCVETETLGGGSWTRSMQYFSPGWVQQVVTTSSDGTQSHTLAYTYNADSTIATRQVNYSFATLTGALSDVYSYDGQGRLIAAVGSSNDQITSYDPNGNIWAVTQAGAAQNFPGSAGSDQLSQTNIGGQSAPATYDARGRMTSSLGRTFSYDDTTNLTTGASNGSQQVQFGYGGHGQRVLKIGSVETTYFTGSSNLPIARVDGSQWSAMVYGPTGLVAIYADQPYFPIKDSEQSVWAVVNRSGIVARCVYLPFGATTADGPNPSVLAYRYMGQEWDSELGLYNFHARMYDPLLRRFLAPDPARQFPSPYVFCGNNPLGATDPSGDISLWAQIGIGIGMAVVLVAGVALSIATFGAAAPAVAGAEVGLAGAEAGAVAGAAVGEAAGAAAAEGGAAAGAAVAEGSAAAAEGGTAAAAEVGAGAAAEGAGAAGAGAAGTTSSALTSAANFGIQVLAGAVESAGTSGLQYDIQNGRDFTAGGFFEAVGWGAASGAIGGALGGIPGLSMFAEQLESFGALSRFGISVAVNGVAGAESAAVTTVLSNVVDHQPWYKGLLESTAIGFGESAVLGGLSEGIKSGGSIGADMQARIGEENVQSITTMVDRVQQAASTSEAYGIYGTAAFFITAGFTVWGATKLYGH